VEEQRNSTGKPHKTGLDTSGQILGGVLGGAEHPPKVKPQKRKRRVRSPHPGVKIVRRRRKAGDVWLARWNDAMSGRQCEQSLTRLGLTTAETRKDWAAKKAQELRDVRKQVSLGFANTTEKTLEAALAEYIQSVDVRCKPSTLRNYRESISEFTNWLQSRGIKRTGAVP
jgi:hypothetical protein